MRGLSKGLLWALGAASLVFVGPTPNEAGAAVPGGDHGELERARALYAEDCQSCHGPDGEGVSGLGPALGAGGTQGAGPALTDAGAASVDFYLSTGYMPLDDPREQPRRTDPEYSPEEIEALVDYVTSFGGPGGKPVPEVSTEHGDTAEGQEIFADHCAGCHQILGEGGLVLDGIAPELRAATETEIAEAVRVGPYVMPAFGPEQIDDSELDSLVRYVTYTQDPEDAGGWGIGHIGPIPEGLVAWIVAALGLVAVARVIGKRLGEE